MTKEYLAELRLLIKQTWHKGRKAFYVNELEVLLGKCARLGEAANWVYHLMTHLYSSAAFALRENREFLGSNSQNFIAHLKKIKELRKREQVGDTRENIRQTLYQHQRAGIRLGHHKLLRCFDGHRNI
jgi:hypothetical protein